MLDQIAEAIARGELDDLPGTGRPLDLADDALIPEDLRMAYRILKNAGFVPPEVEALTEIAALERIAMGNAAAVKKLALLRFSSALRTTFRRAAPGRTSRTGC